jgi:hypothetical protein
MDHWICQIGQRCDPRSQPSNVDTQKFTINDWKDQKTVSRGTPHSSFSERRYSIDLLRRLDRAFP